MFTQYAYELGRVEESDAPDHSEDTSYVDTTEYIDSSFKF